MISQRYELLIRNRRIVQSEPFLLKECHFIILLLQLRLHARPAFRHILLHGFHLCLETAGVTRLFLFNAEGQI